MRRVSGNIIEEDELVGKLKTCPPMDFDLDYVKDYRPSIEFKGATLVTLYDDFQFDLAVPFADFNGYMNPIHRMYHKVNLNEDGR